MIERFLLKHARVEELQELARILQFPLARSKPELAEGVTRKLYRCYQTPVGYMVRRPTLEAMCDRIAKKLKLKPVHGDGWTRLHVLSMRMFERLLASMTPADKRKLIRRMWQKLSSKEKKNLQRDFDTADVSSLIQHSELFVAHVVGIHLARETALYTAAAILRINLGAELALGASVILSRTATLILGPVGWALVALSVNDLMGTEYKRVVPALLAINVISVRAHMKRGTLFKEQLLEALKSDPKEGGSHAKPK
ncbi:MAG: hypothetical protein HQL11_05815 [Candidatus Omnitrophica bacterium]|nr:hypothetical protein [Candidatus Omnitrophota bacterium]